MVYYFFTVGGVFVVVASDTTQTYHVAVVGYLACGLVLTTSSVNSLVYSANGAKEAASAGFILLSMVTVRRLHCLPRNCRNCTDRTFNRLSGFSTLALHLRPFQEPTSILLR